MTTPSEDWFVYLTAHAEADLQHIIDWTLEWFGPKQALVYLETLLVAIDALRPDRPQSA